VERDIITSWFSARKIDVNIELTDKILLFADLIYSTNQKFNLTGLKTKVEIVNELILKSIEPVCDIIVPRGTQFADIGSGAGIPGIPLALFFGGLTGTLIESNKKKADFIRGVVGELNLKDIDIICDRAEALASSAEHREHFDWVFARAFGKLYITLEITASFIKRNGFLYIYSTFLPHQIPDQIIKHAEKLGLSIMSHQQMKEIRLAETGLCFKKEETTTKKYPRKYPVIKREAEKDKIIVD
jgi:16S rRNA (guanine527-N7)-methyltransferase